MANAAAGDIYLVSFSLLMGQQRLLNTFRYRLETVPAATLVETIYTEMDALLTAGGNLFPKYLAAVPPQVLVVERWYQRVFPVRHRKGVFASGLAGTWTGAATATNSAVSIERFAEVATRHGVGRVQLPASNDPADVTNGIITNAAYKTVLDSFRNQMPVSLTLAPSGATMKPVLQDVKLPGTFNYVIGTVRQDTLRVMRRRTVGVGK